MTQGIIRRIFTLAEQLEPDRQVVWDWLCHTRIETLGGHTALELVFADQGERVLGLLENALHDEEGKALFYDPLPPVSRIH